MWRTCTVTAKSCSGQQRQILVLDFEIIYQITYDRIASSGSWYVTMYRRLYGPVLFQYAYASARVVYAVSKEATVGASHISSDVPWGLVNVLHSHTRLALLNPLDNRLHLGLIA